MYASDFAYYRAESLAQARALLGDHPGAKILAGGHSLIPLLKLRLATPSALVDIGRVPELRGITVANGVIRIGALTTHAELATASEIREHAPSLADAAGHVGDQAVRNRGTIGGNVAHADPASDLPCVLAALGATFVVADRNGERRHAADEFFKGMMETAVGEHDILTAIEVPARKKGQGQAYVKFEHPASRYAVIGAAAVLTADKGSCAAASVVLGGLVATPTRAADVEKALVGHALNQDAIVAASRKTDEALEGDVLGDLYASSEYRRAVAHVYVRRALAAAAERAR
jgi:aerobic carbon-monoxide dehydrogenase medium subunit